MSGIGNASVELGDSAAIDGLDGPDGQDRQDAEEMARGKTAAHYISRGRVKQPCISHCYVGVRAVVRQVRPVRPVCQSRKNIHRVTGRFPNPVTRHPEEKTAPCCQNDFKADFYEESEDSGAAVRV